MNFTAEEYSLIFPDLKRIGNYIRIGCACSVGSGEFRSQCGLFATSAMLSAEERGSASSDFFPSLIASLDCNAPLHDTHLPEVKHSAITLNIMNIIYPPINKRLRLEIKNIKHNVIKIPLKINKLKFLK